MEVSFMNIISEWNKSHKNVSLVEVWKTGPHQHMSAVWGSPEVE